MQSVFEGAAIPLGFEWFSLFGLIPIALWAWARRPGRSGDAGFLAGKSGWVALAVGIGILVLPNAIRLWDQTRIRRLVASGQGLQVTRGRIDRHWIIVRRVRDFSSSNSSSTRYKTITSEGFDIGPERFSWNRGDSFSPATLTSFLRLPRPLIGGQEAEVTWFVDEAADGARRIVRLRLGPPPWQAGKAQ